MSRNLRKVLRSLLISPIRSFLISVITTSLYVADRLNDSVGHFGQHFRCCREWEPHSTGPIFSQQDSTRKIASYWCCISLFFSVFSCLDSKYYWCRLYYSAELSVHHSALWYAFMIREWLLDSHQLSWWRYSSFCLLANFLYWNWKKDCQVVRVCSKRSMSIPRL